MITFTAEATVDAPVRVVAEYIAQPENNIHWQPGVVGVRVHPADAPVDLGTVIEQDTRLLGQKMSFAVEVVDYRWGEFVTLRSKKAPVDFEMTMRFAPLDANRTALSMVMALELPGPMQLGAPLVIPVVQREIAKTVERLTAILERLPVAVPVPVEG